MDTLKWACQPHMGVLVTMQIVLDLTLELTFLINSPGESDTHGLQRCAVRKTRLKSVVVILMDVRIIQGL